jgi:hypothetical protein
MLLPTGRESGHWSGDIAAVQSARPRDLGALALVVGVFLVLFVMSITLGSPAIR